MKTRIALAAIIITVLAFSFVSCNPGAQQDKGLGYFAADTYNAIMMAKPAKIINTPLFKDLTSVMDSDIWEEQKQDFKKTFGIELDQWDSIIACFETPNKIIPAPEIDDILVFIGGPFTEENMNTFVQDQMRLQEIEEVTEGDYTFYKGMEGEQEIAFGKVDHGLLFGYRKSTRKAFEVLGGEKHPIAADKNYQKYNSLINGDAVASMLVWGINDPLRLVISFVEMQIEDEDASAAVKALKSVDALGASLLIDKDLDAVVKIKFQQGEDAAKVAEILNKWRDELMNPESDMSLLMPLEKLVKDKEELSELLNDTLIKSSGDVLEIRQKIRGDSKYIDAMKEGIKSGQKKKRQAETMSTIRNLGNAVEQYIMDNYRVGSPKFTDINGLYDHLVELEYIPQDMDLKDGWGNMLVYEADAALGSRTYRIISYGADAQQGPESSADTNIVNENADIVWAEGYFQ